MVVAHRRASRGHGGLGRGGEGSLLVGCGSVAGRLLARCEGDARTKDVSFFRPIPETRRESEGAGPLILASNYVLQRALPPRNLSPVLTARGTVPMVFRRNPSHWVCANEGFHILRMTEGARDTRRTAPAGSHTFNILRIMGPTEESRVGPPCSR